MGIQINGQTDTISAVDNNFSLAGNVSIGGTLTYEDVTSVDAVGLSTFQAGIQLDDSITHLGDTDTKIRFPANDTVTVETGGSERLNIKSDVISMTSSDGVAIGGTTVESNYKLDVSGSAKMQGSNCRIKINGISSNSFSTLEFKNDNDKQSFLWKNGSDASNHASDYGGAHATVLSNFNGPLVFGTNTLGNNAHSERLRITSDGKIGIGEDDPDGNYLLIRAASTVGTTKGHIMLTGDSATNGQGPQIVFSESGSGSSFAGAYVGHIREGSNSTGALVFGTRSTGGDANTVPVERVRIFSDGKIGIGAANNTSYDTNAQNVLIASDGNTGITIRSAGSSPYAMIHFADGTTGNSQKRAGRIMYQHDGDNLAFNTADTERLRITGTGRFGFNTTNPPRDYCFMSGQADTNIQITNYTTGVDDSAGSLIQQDGNDLYIWNKENSFMSLGTNATEKVRITSAGDVGIGVGSPEARLHVEENLSHSSTYYLNADAHILVDNPGSGKAVIKLEGEAALVYGNGSGSLVFADRQNERMRIDSSGVVLVGKTSNTYADQGVRLHPFSDAHFTRNGGNVAAFRRNSSDGTILDFWRDGSSVGNITVSSGTVSLTGAHLSRWTQLPGNAERTEILIGTILTNLDEMCEWTDEENIQLNRMKVSDVEGDKNVAGVFQSWDDDDDTHLNDFYCAMTGDFVIRIAQGVTVARGDLLMSAGDGTAKPQDDDIVRSKTIAKVTSTTVSNTYSDGSYCIPCVLMAC